MPRIDTNWFMRIIKDAGHVSMTQFSKKLKGRNGKPLLPSAVSRMLRGERSMTMDEARQISKLANVPLLEVIARAGIESPAGERMIPIIGYIGEPLNFDSKAIDMIACPPDMPASAVAVFCRTAGTALEPIDGWLLFTIKPTAMNLELVNRFCLVWLENSDKPIFAYVKRSHKPGYYDLYQTPTLQNTERMSAVKISAAAPLLATRC